MTTEEAIRIKKKAFIYAKRVVLEDSEAECIAHQVLLKFLEKESSRQSCEQAVIEVVRQRFGREDLGGRAGMQWAGNSVKTVQIESLLHEPEQLYSTNELDVSVLESIEQAVNRLKYQWGFNNLEIARCFGKSQTWVKNVLDWSAEKIRGAE